MPRDAAFPTPSIPRDSDASGSPRPGRGSNSSNYTDVGSTTPASSSSSPTSPSLTTALATNSQQTSNPRIGTQSTATSAAAPRPATPTPTTTPRPTTSPAPTVTPGQTPAPPTNTPPPNTTIDLAPGSVVRVRDEDWLVTRVTATSDGTLITVQGLSELVRDTSAQFSAGIDRIEPIDPRDTDVVADTSTGHRLSRLWLEATWRKTALPTSDTSLSVVGDMLADPLQYQLTAVRQALDPASLRPRILLADAVGLGKTLEIGMILAELVRRGWGDRILIVSPRHVLEQMQHEMWSRFALPFVRLDSLGIQRVRQRVPATRNPFSVYHRAIISIDTLKNDRYLAHLRKQRWDAVVIDESHNITNRATQNNRLADILARQTDALILASATPHNGDPKSFNELVRLLEPTAVRPDGTRDDDAVRRLVIRRHRHSPEVSSVVGDKWKERQEPVNRLVTPSPEEDAVAGELSQTWLHRSDGALAPGVPSGTRGSQALFSWTLAKAFLSSPAALIETIDGRLNRRREVTTSLGTAPTTTVQSTAAPPVPPQQRPANAPSVGQATTPAAAPVDTHASVAAVTPDGTAVSSSADDAPLTSEQALALEHLLRLATDANTSASGKYRALLEELARIGVGPRSSERVVIFAERIATLNWLREHIEEDLKMPLGAVRVMHGSLSDVEQQEIVEEFRQTHTPIRVLITGDVASEGVNLHSQCHELIHYDIPWSLIRIEQRNGRIDRYGQEISPRITTLLLDPSDRRFNGDIHVLARLMHKEDEAHRALGSAASLMGLYSGEKEEKAIREALQQGTDIDDVVHDAESALELDPMAALFATLTGSESILARHNAATEHNAATGQGRNDLHHDAPLHASLLYPSQVDFLREGLAEIYDRPAEKALPSGGGGVSWRYDAKEHIAELVPPSGLRSRLEVLPQSYLAERGVREHLVLATSRSKAKALLADALRDSSDSSWPEAHYLGPLHPILDWISDRILAGLNRGSVFAMRGAVDAPTVLLMGTLTNRVGRTVSLVSLSAQFRYLDLASARDSLARGEAPQAVAFTTIHPTPAAMFTDVRVTEPQTNPGPVPHLDLLKALIAPAVDAAENQMALTVDAARRDANQRVESWARHVDAWDDDAGHLVQNRQLREQRSTVALEKQLLDQHQPAHTLVRPLLVVVPHDFGTAGEY
ncbi:helicase-related protein [Actinobaculum sp. 313]|uniref:helicase-related protein n=1 Tax=Actinobaculum sp. 313 TaxID=2495645 RepID=UPI003204C007